MAHLVGKDIYRQLGQKIDHLTVRAPWNETFFAILKELYSAEEAEVILKMPYGLSTLNRISRITGIEKKKLEPIIERLCSKGLVIDIWLNDKYRYIPSPMVIGIFEFTMMRTGDRLNTKEWARLFRNYLLGDDSFFAANFRNGEKISIMRALPHEGTIQDSDYVEVLDYEKASAIVAEAEKFSMGICSCRHEKLHLGEKKCETPLDNCSSFNTAADFLIRRNLAREVSKAEMQDNVTRSKELGLVITADNVQQRVSFFCHCCSCCCNALLGIKQLGFPNIVVTSNYIASFDEEECTGCGACAKACPVEAITMQPLPNPRPKKKKKPVLDTKFCLGCGVCTLKCTSHTLKLVPRPQRVLHPETTFERVILQTLERGTLHFQMFDDPHSLSHKIMRGFVGGFLKLPSVKKVLMSDLFRSRFLTFLMNGIRSRRTDIPSKI